VGFNFLTLFSINMNKISTILFFTLAFCFSAKAQLNMELLSQVEYNQNLNDVWGWADPETGIEYAIVGLRNGTSIVSLEDPANATEVAYVPGPSSTWRDIKTWGNFAYVTNETSNGLLVIDMGPLSEGGDVIAYDWTPTIDGLGTLSSCHNLYIDEFGFCYLVGCNLNNGGILVLNVDTETGEPEFISNGPAIYSHDAFAMNNIMYASEIYLGTMTIYDMTDKQNIVQLASQPTPFTFTHNIWTNDDQSVAFTTDERADAPVAAYDITDYDNIQELDLYNPIGSLGTGVIPHNVHVWNDYLLISYYTDGGRVVDASRPENLIEVGNYDTWLGGDGGFSGAWGLYPFLPSQTVLVTDINNGLYVIAPTFVRACWLEGIVTDELTGQTLSGVTVEIDSEQPNLGVTTFDGTFETGQAISGTFDVSFAKAGYLTEVISVELVNGEVTEVEVELSPLGSFSVGGQAIEDENGNGVPGAIVTIIGEDLSYTTTSDASGNFSLLGIVQGTYDLYAAQWGYTHTIIEGVVVDNNTTSLTVEMGIGYQDDFFADLGWTTETQGATSGEWERAEPIGTNYNDNPSNTDFDVSFDIGDECYVTGNGGGGAGDDDVDNGNVILYSPVMDLSDYIDPVMSFSYWFFNDGGNGSAPNDRLIVEVTNGQETVEIINITQSLPLWRDVEELHVGEEIELTDNMQLIITTGDDAANGHLVEAAFDALFVEDTGIVNSTDDEFKAVQFDAFPNPFSEAATINYDFGEKAGVAQVNVFNGFGQQIHSERLLNQTGQLTLGKNLPNGIYWVKLEIDGEVAKTARIVKTK
jgi:choice-of-anchor B domain-containing protein